MNISEFYQQCKNESGGLPTVSIEIAPCGFEVIRSPSSDFMIGGRVHLNEEQFMKHVALYAYAHWSKGKELQMTVKRIDGKVTVSTGSYLDVAYEISQGFDCLFVKDGDSDVIWWASCADLDRDNNHSPDSAMYHTVELIRLWGRPETRGTIDRDGVDGSFVHALLVSTGAAEPLRFISESAGYAKRERRLIH